MNIDLNTEQQSLKMFNEIFGSKSESNEWSRMMKLMKIWDENSEVGYV